MLAATQLAQSQQYTTTTLTTLLTSNQVSTVTVGTQTMTTTSNQLTPVYVGPNVTIQRTHGVCGEYFNQPFNATAGEVLTGNVSASKPVNVYLMTASAFQTWQHQVVAGGTCTPPSPVLSQTGVTTYPLGTPIPVTGDYQLVVNNLSESAVTVQLTANLASASTGLTTSVVYSTVTQPMVQTMMQTSVQTVQATSSGPDMTTVAAIIFAIIVIAAIAYVAKTRKSKSQKK